jgi:hypothetical protein
MNRQAVVERKGNANGDAMTGLTLCVPWVVCKWDATCSIFYWWGGKGRDRHKGKVVVGVRSLTKCC